MKQPRRKTVLYSMGLLGGLIAVAMWGKMRFVSHMPKIAYANPDADRGDELQPAEGRSVSETDNEQGALPDTGGLE